MKSKILMEKKANKMLMKKQVIPKRLILKNHLIQKRLIQKNMRKRQFPLFVSREKRQKERGLETGSIERPQ